MTVDISIGRHLHLPRGRIVLGGHDDAKYRDLCRSRETRRHAATTFAATWVSGSATA